LAGGAENRPCDSAETPNSRLYAPDLICFGRRFTNSKLAMSTPANPSDPTPAGKDRNVARAEDNAVMPSFEDKLRLFWQRNSAVVTGVLVAVLLAIAAKGGWEYLQQQRDQEIGQAYAAATTPAQLKSFVSTYPKHTLAAVAQLRMADEAYAGGRYAEAAGLYETAVPMLEQPALASRARFGLAAAKLQSDRATEGEAALKAFVNDANEVKSFRASAAYLLASHGLASGRPEDLKTYSELLMQIDPTSPWTQRAVMLQASQPVSSTGATAVPDASAPAITLPGTK
jgi:predicted negative regulator of RcsB-dependent stress response